MTRPAASPRPSSVAARIGGPGWHFNAAHTGIHNGVLEPLHGHSYQVTAVVSGELGDDGMIADFAVLKQQLREIIAPLKRRTLLPANAPGIVISAEGTQLHITHAGTSFCLPVVWVVQLPIASTSTEALAGYIAEQFAARVAGECPLVERIEITLAESAECAATVKMPVP